jgi:hypothetical protein
MCIFKYDTYIRVRKGHRSRTSKQGTQEARMYVYVYKCIYKHDTYMSVRKGHRSRTSKQGKLYSVCVYVCMYVCVYIYIYIYIYICIHTYVRAYLFKACTRRSRARTIACRRKYIRIYINAYILTHTHNFSGPGASPNHHL